MTYIPEIHHRRSIRLRGYDYSRNGAYFVTVCARNRECLFGEIMDGEMALNEYGRIVSASWEWLGVHYDYVELDAWVIMPNHIHGIIVIEHGCCDGRRGGSRTAPTPTVSAPTPTVSAPPTVSAVKPKSVGRLIGAFKTVSTKQINQIRNTPGISVWQRNYYEHVIRDEQSLENIRNYIIHNPAKWAEDENNIPPLEKGHANQ